MTRWWWVRHAPVPTAEGRILGCLDWDAETGDAARFARLAERLPPGAALIESGLARCRQTADALRRAGMALPPARIEPDLREQDFGHWQGLAWGEAAGPDDPFWADPAGTAPPGGESFAAVMRRVKAALDRHEQDEGDIIVIAHAGPIRAAVARALDLTPSAALRLVVDPLSITRVDGGGRVLGLNWAG